jgi:tripartite-type tricarboxylate transporter receptor subunit TctC
MNSSTTRLALKALWIVLLGWVSAVGGQEWPKQRPVTLVVAFAPGSITDLMARLVAQKLSESLAQAVVVDNRPGAAGNIAAQRVMRAAPDGYSFLVASSAFAVNPTLYVNSGYDPFRDFVPVVLAASTPNLICVHPSVPAQSLQELMELARRQPLAYSMGGLGTTPHLSMERIKTAAKVSITTVPYQPAQAVTAVVAGETQVASIAMGLAVANIKAGKLRPIAVTSAQRSRALPDVPTVNEQGFSGFNDLTWFAFFAPAGTPLEIADRLNAEINRILELPEVRDKLGQFGLDSSRNTRAEFSSFLKEEVPKWAQAVKDSGAKVD